MNLLDGLEFMKSVLKASPKAMELLGEVWNSYGGIGFDASHNIQVSSYAIGLKCNGDFLYANPPFIGLSLESNRKPEALTHELLHLKLGIIGYPKLCQNYPFSDDNLRLSNDIVNIAEHRLIKPLFLKMGFSEELFLSPQEINDDWKARIQYFEEGQIYDSPKAFQDKVTILFEKESLVGSVWGVFENSAWIEHKIG